MKTGLVLEGGGMRGMFTAGVLDVLMEQGIPFDGAIGVSAGACFGCNYKSHQIGRTLRYNVEFAHDWRYASWRSLLTTGNFFGTEFAYREVPLERDPFDTETFEKDPMEFWVVATNVLTGGPVYHQMLTCNEEELDWIRASSSMPLVSEVVKVGGRLMLDGGIADSIPVRFFEKQGYERNVIVLTQPADYVKEPVGMMPLIRASLRKYPKVVEAMAKRHEVYNETKEYISTRVAEGAAFVILPPEPLDIGHIEHDVEEILRVYNIGRKTAEKQLPELKRFLGRA